MCLFFRSLRFQFLEVSEKAKFCTNKFLANVWVWQNCQLQAIFREFYISCSFDPFVFVKDRICQFLNRLKIGAMRKIDLFWKSFNIGVVLESANWFSKHASHSSLKKAKWSRLGSLFSPFVLSEDRKLTSRIFHFSQNSFLSDSGPTFGGGEKRLHVSTFIP